MAEVNERMSFMTHLEELRKRLIRIFIAVGIGFAACWHWAGLFQDFLTKPLLDVLPEGQRHLTALKVTDPFVIQLKLGFYAGLLLTAPYIIYQIWAFVAPALYRRERRYGGVFTVSSLLLFGGGLAFGYYVFLPLCFKFFVTFISGYLVQGYNLSDYISFTVWSLLAFGIVFQTPLILLLLNLIGLVHVPFLKRFRKYAFLLSFAIGAILTPTPDMVNQTVMSLPIYFFYEVSIVLIRLFGKKPPPAADDPAEKPAAPAG
jgi:sec-independent protein translocase protein TatC